MDFEVLYKLDVYTFQWQALLISISLIFLGMYAIRLIKRYGFKLPMLSWAFFPNLNFSLIGKFFSFIIAFFGIIILIAMLVQIPIGIIECKNVKELIDNDNYKTIEGHVENFLPADNLDKQHESFEISGVRFSYSEFDDIYGYSTTSINGGVVKSNGQYLRVNYYIMNGQNIICKIEGIKNH